MIHLEEVDSIMEIARDACKTLSKHERKQPKLIEEINQYLKTADLAKELFEEYSVAAFINKKKLDDIVYSQLLEGKFDKLNINIEEVKMAVDVLYSYVDEIYEFINIKPEVHSSLTSDLLECSLQETKKKVSDFIFEYLNKNFHSLTTDMKIKLYLEDSRECIKELLKEDADVEAATSFCVKKKLMEGFLRRLAFPFGVWERIQLLSESEDYGKFFDQNKLIELVEDFKVKLEHVASIVSAVI